MVKRPIVKSTVIDNRINETFSTFLQVAIPPLRAFLLFDKTLPFFSFLLFRLAVFIIVFYITGTPFLFNFNNAYFLIVATTGFTLIAFAIQKFDLVYKLGKIVLNPKNRHNTYFAVVYHALISFAIALFITFEFILATTVFWLFLLDVSISFLSLMLEFRRSKV